MPSCEQITGRKCPSGTYRNWNCKCIKKKVSERNVTTQVKTLSKRKSRLSPKIISAIKGSPRIVSLSPQKKSKRKPKTTLQTVSPKIVSSPKKVSATKISPKIISSPKKVTPKIVSSPKKVSPNQNVYSPSKKEIQSLVLPYINEALKSKSNNDTDETSNTIKRIYGPSATLLTESIAKKIAGKKVWGLYGESIVAEPTFDQLRKFTVWPPNHFTQFDISGNLLGKYDQYSIQFEREFLAMPLTYYRPFLDEIGESLRIGNLPVYVFIPTNITITPKNISRKLMIEKQDKQLAQTLETKFRQMMNNDIEDYDEL